MTWIRKFAALVMLVTCSCSAQTKGSRPGSGTVIWSPPMIDWGTDSPKPTVPKEMILTLRVANFPIILEKTRLEDAQKRFGGSIGRRGDAGDSEAWLCLHGSGADGSWMFWLTSGEMGEGSYIDGFQWRRLSPNETPDRRCRLLPQDNSIELPVAIRPGITEQQVRQILGQPTTVRGKTLVFSHEHRVILRKENWTSSNDIAVLFRDGVVWAIEVAQSTSD